MSEEKNKTPKMNLLEVIEEAHQKQVDKYGEERLKELYAKYPDLVKPSYIIKRETELNRKNHD